MDKEYIWQDSLRYIPLLKYKMHHLRKTAENYKVYRKKNGSYLLPFTVISYKTFGEAIEKKKWRK